MNPAVLRVSNFERRLRAGMIADSPNSKSWDHGQSVSWSFADSRWRSHAIRR